jgi:serine/threonine protein kinase
MVELLENLLILVVLYSCDDKVWKIAEYSYDLTLEGSNKDRTLGVRDYCYSAPEVYRKIPVTEDGRCKSDVWSAGCIFFELAVGKRTFPSRYDVFMYDRGNAPPPPIPLDFCAARSLVGDVINQALERDAKNRPTAVALLENVIAPSFLREMGHQQKENVEMSLDALPEQSTDVNENDMLGLGNYATSPLNAHRVEPAGEENLQTSSSGGKFAVVTERGEDTVTDEEPSNVVNEISVDGRGRERMDNIVDVERGFKAPDHIPRERKNVEGDLSPFAVESRSRVGSQGSGNRSFAHMAKEEMDKLRIRGSANK